MCVGRGEPEARFEDANAVSGQVPACDDSLGTRLESELGLSD
jgi:hypothetical protein